MNALVSAPYSFTSGSRAGIWTGRVLTGLLATFLLVDAAAKLAMLAPVIEATTKIGYSVDHIRPLGVTLAVSMILHLVPRTQLVGAVLVTAYLGGAVATHVRTGTPIAYAVITGVLLWIAYYLRSPQLRALLSAKDAR
jgi:hypothetical protein